MVKNIRLTFVLSKHTDMKTNRVVLDLTKNILFFVFNDFDHTVDISDVKIDDDTDYWYGFSYEGEENGWDLNLWFDENNNNMKPMVTIYPVIDGQTDTNPDTEIVIKSILVI